MTSGDAQSITGALIDLSRQVGACTEATRGLEITLQQLSRQTEARIADVEARIAGLESERDQRIGAGHAAQDHLARVDRRLRLVGGVLTVLSIAEIAKGAI